VQSINYRVKVLHAFPVVALIFNITIMKQLKNDTAEFKE